MKDFLYLLLVLLHHCTQFLIDYFLVRISTWESSAPVNLLEHKVQCSIILTFSGAKTTLFLSWCYHSQLHHCEQQRNLAFGTFHDYWRNKESNWLWELNGLKFNFPSNQQVQTGLEYLYLNRKQILLLYSLSVWSRGRGGRNCFCLLPWVPKDDCCFSFPHKTPAFPHPSNCSRHNLDSLQGSPSRVDSSWFPL